MALPVYPPDRRREIAQQLEIEEQYLYQICRGLKIASPTLARQLNTLDPAATLKDLRPKDWHKLWPELATPDTPSTSTAEEGASHD